MKLPHGISEQDLCTRLDQFRIETPSWGYADTGTRFGKFLQDAAATTISEKLADAAVVNAVTGCCPRVALHVLWDIKNLTDPNEPAALTALAKSFGVQIGSINPNVFQDQCYKLGSVSNRDPAIRRRAIDHLIASVRVATALSSDTLSLWFADGTSYPGQGHLRQRKRWFQEALAEVHAALPASMTMLIEYKPFEPFFYHTDIADWGMSAMLARRAGPRAKVLVDTGHHLPTTNIEHIVSFLIDESLLGGFHFNDRKYADDDLAVGSIDPYQLFRIFNEIVLAEREWGALLNIPYMIDQSHNLKPKIEEMIETVVMAQEIFTKALLVDHAAAASARASGDIVMSERPLKDAFATDVRPFLAEYRKSRNLPADPLDAFRQSGYLARAAADRAPRKSKSGGSYA